MLRCLVCLFALLASFSTYAQNALRDEWESIDRIVVATDTFTPAGGGPSQETLRPFTLEIMKIAIERGIRVTVVDGNEQTQGKALQDLKDKKVVDEKTEKYVGFTESKHNTGFARDEAPIAVFDEKTNALKKLTGTVFENDADSKKIVSDVAKATGLLQDKSLVKIEPKGFMPMTLQLDGGDLMTTDKGKTLITTSNFYENNGLAAHKKALDDSLKEPLGITKVIELEPLKKNTDNYELENAHVDLQIRTLPGGKVIVAETPEGDDQHQILNRNAKKLEDEGYTVIRVMNAPQGDTKSFKTYTNALFLNDKVVVPGYNDAAKDAAAKKAYDDALNMNVKPGQKKDFEVMIVDASDVIKDCGAARCIAREIGKAPSSPKGKEAKSRTPMLSFDAGSGTLSFTDDVINFLGSPGQGDTDALFEDDVMLGARIQIGDMRFNPGMSQEDRFAFVDGSILIDKDGQTLFEASIPVFSIYGTTPEGTLGQWGVLDDIVTAASGTSSWLDAFVGEVLDDPLLLPDFFFHVPVDLIALSNRFRMSVDGVQLAEAGIVGNGQFVSEPPTAALVLVAWLVLWAVAAARKHHAIVC